MVARVAGVELAEFEGALVEVITVSVWTVLLAFIQWLLTRPTLMPFFEAIGLGTGVENEATHLPRHGAPGE